MNVLLKSNVKQRLYVLPMLEIVLFDKDLAFYEWLDVFIFTFKSKHSSFKGTAHRRHLMCVKIPTPIIFDESPQTGRKLTTLQGMLFLYIPSVDTHQEHKRLEYSPISVVLH